MFWVLQKNLRNEQALWPLQAQLVAQQTPHAMVTLRPGVDEMEPDLVIEGPVFVRGGGRLRRIAQRKGWSPGYIDDNVDYRLLINHYEGRMVNDDARIVTIRDAVIHGAEVFVRPVLDDKLIDGQVMSRDRFLDWQRGIVAVNGGGDLIIIASPKVLYAEYRFFVVDGRVVTGSLYKRGPNVYYDAHVDESVTRYAQSCADTWCPNLAFCLDVADTPDGLKVLEINGINSSGAYACDMGKFVHAINALA